jgi:hypothetical protein
MNNILSPTAQYLAVMGHHVDLFLLYEYDHFLPEADYINSEDIKFNTIKLEMKFGEVMNIPISKITSNLLGYDFYIGTDYAPAILSRINIRLDMYAWAGTDLFDWPFYKSKFVIPQLWEIEKILTSKLQKTGIKNTRYMPMSINNDFISEAISKIGFKGEVINPLPFLYYPNVERKNSFKYQDKVEKIKSESDLLIVQQGRQWWKTAPKHISKGNDVFLKGVRKFLDNNQSVKVAILLFEYGADVEHTKQLAVELGIDKNIYWLSLMLRKELLSVLSYADIGVGQFGVESWYLYCSNTEIIASKCMYMGYRHDGYYKSKNVDLYPMLNANNEDQIAERLEDFHKNKVEFKLSAKNAYDWLIDYNEKYFLNQIRRIMEIKSVRSLPLKDNFLLVFLKSKLLIVAFINRIVLLTRINILKKSILEWVK